MPRHVRSIRTVKLSMAPRRQVAEGEAMNRVLSVLRTSSCLLMGLASFLAPAAPVSQQGTWETTLRARNSNGVEVPLQAASAVYFYDTVLDLTWLGNAGAFAGTWDQSVAWANALSVFGVTGWRLPTLINVADSCQFDPVIDGSELRHMFFSTLGNGKSCSFSAPALTNTGPFVGLQVGFYWSGIENPNFATDALDFLTAFGQGSSHNKSDNVMYAWAVRDGDVLRPIPEPATLMLIAIAGFGLAATRMRSQAGKSVRTVPD